MSAGKRLMDLVLSAVSLLVLAPILVVLWMAVRMFIGKPAIFAQKRPGKNGVPFVMFKFRTMTNERDGAGQLLPDELRLTRFGQLLRSTSLDELPELINVLRGEMSLVGPRPLLMSYLDRYTPRQMRRHEVLPGVTGWAQVNGRNAISWEERLELDVWYVENRSLLLDCHILWRTIASVASRRGVAAEGYVTMPEFRGTAGLADESMNNKGRPE